MDFLANMDTLVSKGFCDVTLINLAAQYIVTHFLIYPQYIVLRN